ncbi:hypothetical protein [Actinomadura violacea]|uniref:DUF3558 domain-containing protein n=1 Tax=Actinomadura violacea TaxID=2819934 RepID=A0ABS3RLP1_9ACTN|nr:hypothetical protein [Actinomadura violacea]MBO2457488.1 hypothetical protein [Actinomadura violacea]
MAGDALAPQPRLRGHSWVPEPSRSTISTDRKRVVITDGHHRHHDATEAAARMSTARTPGPAQVRSGGRGCRLVVMALIGAAVFAAWRTCAPDRPEHAPPLLIGTARPGTTRIAPGTVGRPDGFVDGTGWPDACAFLSDAEIRAVLPQAARIRRTGGEVGLSTMNAFDATGGPLTAPRASCTYKFEVPGLNGVVIRVVEEIDARPEVVDMNWSNLISHRDDVPGALGAENCAAGTAAQPMTCRKGQLAYDVSFDLLQAFSTTALRGRKLHVRHGGKSTAFDLDDDRRGLGRFQNTVIEPELAKTINAKIVKADRARP